MFHLNIVEFKQYVLEFQDSEDKAVPSEHSGI